MAELEVRAVSKRFGDTTVLDSVDLEAVRGEIVAVLGASGSGKTTLLRLFCGFEMVDSGTIDISGRRVSAPGLCLAPEQRHIGYVAQEGALFPHLSVAGNIVFGLPRQQRKARDRVAELLKMVGLPTDFAGRSPNELSGGEQQRVALARALAPGPRLVLLDEPFSALDAALRIETRRAVVAALRAMGTTALLVTHDQAEAFSTGDRVAVLRNGAVAQFDTPEALYRQPADPQLARFVGEAVLIHGVAQGNFVDCALGRLPLANCAPESRILVMLRPEQIRLSPDPEGPEDQGPGTRAIVREVEFHGQDAKVGLTLSNKREAGQAVVARVPSYMTPHPGDRVQLFVRGQVVAYPITER